MKTKTSTLRLISFLLLLLALGLPANTQAQEHEHKEGQKHEHTEKAKQDAAMEHGDMMDKDHMQSMMTMHHHMMADSVIHQRMMDDPDMRSVMQEMMGGGMNMDEMHAHMAAMPQAERQQMMEQMHERMMQKMEAMSPEASAAMMHRMMEVHNRLVADPEVKSRMMADPEMRQMMEKMHEGGMMEGMDHDQMEGMDHDQMEGMDHDKMEGMSHDAMNHDQMGASMSTDEVRDAEAASRTADRFREALTAGDRDAVMALLHPDVVIMEGGNTETRTEYLGHHFGGDSAFLAAVDREPMVRKTEVTGNAAWVTSTSRLHGTYKDRALDLNSAELLVLRRDAEAPTGWLVAAVHWSSRSNN